MTESQSRSGLDLPEGSANADKVEETGLVDTNADDARNPQDSDQDQGSTDQPEQPDQPNQQPA